MRQPCGKRRHVSGYILLITLAVGLNGAPDDTSILRLREFQTNPALTARAGQMVILDELPPDPSQPAIRYRLSSGKHEICLHGNQAYFTGLVVEHANGQKVQPQISNGSCTTVEVAEGVYTIRMLHGLTGFSDPARISFVNVDSPSPPLVDASGDAIGGFWAVQPDPISDPKGQSRDGRLHSVPPLGHQFIYLPADPAMAIVADFDSLQIDQYSLFRFRYGGATDLAPFLPANTILDIVGNNVAGSVLLPNGAVVVANWTCPSTPPDPYNGDFRCQVRNPNGPLKIIDKGHYQFQLQSQGKGFYYWGNFYFFPGLPTPTPVLLSGAFASALNLDIGPNPAYLPMGTYRLLFRFFPDGSMIGPLQDGEVALYEQCNYQGRTIVLGADMANFLQWNSDTVGLDKMGASIKLGNNAAVTFFAGPNFTGNSQTLTVDQPCAAGLPASGSILISSAVSVLNSTKKCQGCKLNGVDFSGTDLTAVDLTAAHLVGSILNLTKLNRAILQQTDLSYATLFGAQLNNANLTGANLYHAFLANNNNGNISHSASLRQAHLKNANLSFAELSGVDFTFANFYGDNAAGTGTCNTSGSNYEGFTNGCATAHGATMIDTTFDSAYLFGVDFTAAQGKGVSFLQSVLVGANFAGATLTADPNSGKVTSFNRAFLQGANLQAALSSVNLSDAFVDFGATANDSQNGNDIYILLAGPNHNQFTCPPGGCNPTAGEDVCVAVTYAPGTTLPATDGTVTCPDGSAGNCGGTADPAGNFSNPKWKSTLSTLIVTPPTCVPPAWYDSQATYTPASPDNIICNGKGSSNATFNW